MAFAGLFSSLQAVIRGNKPSSLLKDMLATGRFDEHPVITDMVGCLQNPEKHPEGDVWQHTLNVVDAAAQLKDNVPEEWRTAYMFAALLHDVGKPSVTTPDLKAYKHDAAGEPLARQFIMSLTNDSDMAAKVASIVLCHMRPWGLVRDNASDKAWRKLHAACPLHVLAYMSMADASGKGEGLKMHDEGALACLNHAGMLCECCGETTVPQGEVFCSACLAEISAASEASDSFFMAKEEAAVYNALEDGIM